MSHQIALLGLMALTHILCYAAMTERKYSVRKTALIYALYAAFFLGSTLVLSACLGAESTHTVSIAFSATIAAGFLIFIWTSSDVFCKKLFLFISYSNLFCIFHFVAVLICNALFPSMSGIEMQYARNIARTLLYIPTVLAYLKFLRPRIRTVPVRKKRTWYSISLVSTLFLVAFASFVVLFYPYNSRVENVILFAVVVMIYCSVLWVVFEAIRYMNDESKMELIEKNTGYLQGQLALAKENELAARTIRHDFRHHNQNIAALLQKGDIKEALRYVQQYHDSLDAAKPKVFCPHATVNAILSSFSIKAQKDGILMSASADTQQESSIADMDFVAILSNLLENALNGCKECGSHGEIHVDIHTVSNKTVIVCRNPCKPGLAIENGMLLTRGTGIDSMVLAARKYGGNIRYTLENNVLTVCVILNG